MRKKTKRLILLMMAGLFVLPSLLNVIIPPSSTYAAADSPEDQLERWLYYRGVRACFEGPDFDDWSPGGNSGTKSVSDLNSKGIEEYNHKEGFGYLAKDLDDLDGDDGTVQCDGDPSGKIWNNVAAIYGFDSVPAIACALNAAASKLGDGGRIKPSPDISPCIENATKFEFEGGGNIWQGMITKALEDPISSDYGGDGDRPRFDFNDNQGTGYTYKSMLYVLGKNSLETFCGGSLESAEPNDSYSRSDQGVSVYIVNSDGTIEESGAGDAGFSHTYAVSKKDDEGDDVSDVYYSHEGNSNEADDRSCEDMARWTREGAREYAQWLKEYGDQDDDDDGDDTGVTDPGEDESTCKIDGVGWILCPAVIAISKFNDSLFALLEGLLGVNPSMFDTNGRSAATYNTWQAVRNLANVAFVIAFMVIIYSQLTGMGLSNYGIKKMLPRIAIAAILVNISFWVCAAAVDISNIAGSSLHDLLVDQVNTMGGGVGDNLGMWDKVTAWLLAGGVGTLAIGGAALAVGAYGFLGALALLIPLAVVALVAALTVVFVLVARQAFIIILVVLSPLAFVAYLLPNTEQWFDRWRKTLFTLLLIYPLMALLFGGSQVASAIIRNGADDALVFLLSLVVLVVPLFMVPFLLKFSGGLLGKIGGMVNNPNRGPFDRLKKSSANYADRQRGLKMGDNIARTEGFRTGSGGALGATGSRRRRAASWLSGIGNSNAVDAAQKDTYAKAAADSAKRDYVAERALEAGSDYAAQVGGSEAAAKYVKSYAIQAKQDELEKDIKASQLLYKEKARTMDKDAYMQHLQDQIHSSSTQMFEKRAAMREFGTVSNAAGVGAMAEKMAALGSDPSVSKQDKADLQREFASTFKGDGRMPINVSSTNKSEMETGDFTKTVGTRIAETVGKGKLNSSHFGRMDIDEMVDWNKQLTTDPSLLANSGSSQIKAVKEAIEAAEKDPRINVNFGDREVAALAEMKQHLESQFNEAAKREQNAAAATYGPGI